MATSSNSSGSSGNNGSNATPSPKNLSAKHNDPQVDIKHNPSADNDPQVEDTPVNTQNRKDESPQEILARSSSGEIANDPDEGFIVHRQQYVDNNGVTRTKEHGPMPRGEWPSYSRENNL